MDLFLLLVALAVVGAVAAVATGRVRAGLDEPTTSRPYRALPEERLRPGDVDAVRFSLGLRGYRMDEVDDVLERLRDELAERDAEIAGLRGATVQGTAADARTADDEPAGPVEADHDGTADDEPAQGTTPDEHPGSGQRPDVHDAAAPAPGAASR